ncbi:hypothetical protein E4U25_000219, partial [Claviceps purpurea]
MFTKDEAAALPQVHFFFHKRREPLVPPMILEYMRLAYLAVIRSGFNPVEIFVRNKLHNTTFDRRRGEVKPDTEGWHLT